MSNVTNTNGRVRYRFVEGGNTIALAAITIALILCVLFYGTVSGRVSALGIKIEDVYSYVFNLFAIGFGSLLALFALFACRPTSFLERMKSTYAFAAIMSATKITMAVIAFSIAVTFVLGVLRLNPDTTLTWRSVLFLVWAAVSAAATCFFARTVRLIFLTLA
jgi:hypothetical protein